MIDKIFYMLFQSKELNLKLHVKLMKESDGKTTFFHQIFSYGDKEYLKLDVQTFLTLDIKDKTAWDKDKSIMIHERNIYQIIRGMRKVIDAIYNNGIFAIDKSNEVIAYADKIIENTIKLFHIGSNQRMILTPSVIYDFDNISCEGCTISINKNANVVQLTVDELESLYYTLTKVDFFTYGNLLLNYYVNSLDKIDNKAITKMNKKEIPIPQTIANGVESRLIKPITDDEYFKIL